MLVYAAKDHRFVVVQAVHFHQRVAGLRLEYGGFIIQKCEYGHHKNTGDNNNVIPLFAG